MSNDLMDVQRDMMAAIVDGEIHAPALVQPVVGLTAEQSMTIYHADYYERIAAQLAVMFPALNQVLGESAFFSLCSDALQSQVPTGVSIREYGRVFLGFLQQKISFGFPRWLVELAEYEQLIMLVLDGPGVTSVADMSALLQQTEQVLASMIIRGVSGVQTIELSYPIAQIRHDILCQLDKEWQVVPARTQYIVWREQDHVSYKEIESEIWAQVLSCVEGCCVLSVLDNLDRSDHPELLFSLLQCLFAQGCLEVVEK